MTTKDYREKSPLLIFLRYFKNHKKLFALDVSSGIETDGHKDIKKMAAFMKAAGKDEEA
jgi:hypothetical protein